MEEKITYVRIPKLAVKCDKRSSQKLPPAPRTKALRRGKAPLSHESQPFRHSFLSALAECLEAVSYTHLTLPTRSYV